MKEYNVIKIKCRKNLNMADAFSYIKGKVTSNSNFFSFQDIVFNVFLFRQEIMAATCNLFAIIEVKNFSLDLMCDVWRRAILYRRMWKNISVMR